MNPVFDKDIAAIHDEWVKAGESGGVMVTSGCAYAWHNNATDDDSHQNIDDGIDAEGRAAAVGIP